MIKETTQTLMYRIVVSSVIIVLVSWLAYQYVEQAFADARNVIEQQLYESEQRVVAWYENPADIGAYDQLLRNRPQCSSSERIDYESILQNLGTGLSASDLVFLLSQFDRCATIVAHRYYQLHVLTSFEISQMEQLIEQVATLPGTVSGRYSKNISLWYEYVDALLYYVELQINLDELQRSLIVARLNQEPVDGEEISGLLEAVGNLRAHLSQQKQLVDERFAAITL